MTYPPFVLFDNSNAQHQKSSCYDNILSTNDVQYCQSVLNHHVLQVWEDIYHINLGNCIGSPVEMFPHIAI